MNSARPRTILIIAPIGRDAELMCSKLEAAGLECTVCDDIRELADQVEAGVGAIVVTEEALSRDGALELTRALSDQPPWSEIPLIILSGSLSLEGKPHALDALMRRTNVTLIDRPVRIRSLISTAQSALRARERQYDVRDLMLQLEERIHERDRFLAVLGHELRNPLGAILLGSQMTDANGRLEADQAQLIERQSRHLSRLVNDLLDLSRVAAGKIVLKKQTVDLLELVKQSLETIAPAARTQQIELAVHLCEPPVLVHADPVRVEQIVTNVLGNAIKYTPEKGHVTLVVSCDGNEALIRVSDDGVGIAPERIGVIFELFAQAENAIGRAQGGMGIGLALVRNLVELHDGSVEAQSDGVGKGSQFAVHFPLATAEQRAAVLSARPPEPKAVPPTSRRVAIVEDNKDVRDLLRLKLRRLGHDVVDAADGIDGVRVVLEARPDLALIDLGLPGIDGYEVARRLREQIGGTVILVAVSGFGQPEDKRRAIEAGFDEHLTKPADMRDIESLLVRLPPRNSAPL